MIFTENMLELTKLSKDLNWNHEKLRHTDRSKRHCGKNCTPSKRRYLDSVGAIRFT